MRFLIAVHKARSEFVGIEHLSDDEVEALRADLEEEARQNPGSSRALSPKLKKLLQNRSR